MARHGENIFRRKDGRWEARLPEHRVNGSRTYRSFYGKSYAEAKAKKETYRDTVHRKPASRELTAFSYLAESWLAAVKVTVKESSYTRYHRNVYSYLVPSIGQYAISGIDAALAERMREDLLSRGGKRGAGLSDKTVSDIFSTLKRILLYASEHGYPAANIASLRNPRKARKKAEVIPDDDIHRLESILLDSKESICPGILLTLHTGLRSGELCGLRWGDFDFRSSSVQIRRTVERIDDLTPSAERKTKVITGEPKTDTSRRVIPLPGALCRYLREHRKEDGSYLLTGTDRPSEPHTLYVRFERFLKRNGFGKYSFHALRHTFATRGIAFGFDAKSMSEILGHSDVTTTLRCYVHPSIEQKRKQMENLFDSRGCRQKYGL